MRPDVAICVKFRIFYTTEIFTAVMVAVKVTIFTEESASLKCDAVSLWEHSHSMKSHSSPGNLSTTRPTTKRHIPNDLIFTSTAVRT